MIAGVDHRVFDPQPASAVPPRADRGPAVRLCLIGQMQARTASGESFLPAGRKTRGLLAVLALSAGRPVLRARLAELLWSRRPEEQARASLRQEIHRLLDALGPGASEVLAVSRDHLVLRPGAAWVDVEEVLRATLAHPSALGLLRAELLEDLGGMDPAFDVWLAAERERFRDSACRLAEAVLREQVDPETTIAAAQRLLAIDRAHEGAWRALMRAHVARGERGMAIQAYQRCRIALADLLDATPSAETQHLLAEIRGPAGSRIMSAIQSAGAPGGVKPVLLSTPIPPAAPAMPAEPRGFALGLARVGVWPLRLIGLRHEEASQFAQGLAEELTVALARFRSMALVSSTSLAPFATEARDEAAIRRHFGLDFVLDGTIQRSRDRLRVLLRLVDLRARSQVAWAGRFDRPADDLMVLQEDIAAAASAQLDPEILAIEEQRAASGPTRPDAAAAELCLRALPLVRRLERAPFLHAGTLLTEAVARDPDDAAAHAWLAYWHVLLVRQGWHTDHGRSVTEASRLSERALLLDPQDARAFSIAGHVRASLQFRLQEAAALHDRALALNPNLVTAWSLSAATFLYLGDLDAAERHCARVRHLAPAGSRARPFDSMQTALHLLRHNHEATVAAGRELAETSPSFADGMKPYLAALGHLGLRQEAAMVRRRLLANEPGFTVARFLAMTPFARAADREHLATGLKLAEVPEGSLEAA